MGYCRCLLWLHAGATLAPPAWRRDGWQDYTATSGRSTGVGKDRFTDVECRDCDMTIPRTRPAAPPAGRSISLDTNPTDRPVSRLILPGPG